MRLVLAAALRDLRRDWRQLLLADLLFKAIAFSLLTPMVAILFRALLAFSGDSVLADQDILFFLFTPVGWVCLITVGGLSVGIAAMELATLMAIVVAGPRQASRVPGAIWFATRNGWPVVQVTARVAAWSLLAAAPFVAVAGAVYFSLLTQHDINYYLQAKPPVFLLAVGIGAALAVAFLAVMLWLATSWLYALPLALFERVRPGDALRESFRRARGGRRPLFVAILVWAVASLALSIVATAAVVELAKFFVPRATGSLTLLAFAVGASALAWSIVTLGVNLLSMTSFAALQVNLYRALGGGDKVDPATLDLGRGIAATGGYRITLPRAIALSIIGMLAAVGVGALAINDVRLDDDVEVMAHRGASHSAPENTMAAIELAIQQQADWVEIDVQETLDGEVVVFHDSDFMKLANVDLKIWDANLADLDEIDIGSWFDPQFDSQRVPTLAQVLRRCRGAIGVNIELKHYGHNQQLEQRVAQLVEAEGMSDSIVTMSLKIGSVSKMKSLRPTWKSGLLMSVAAGDLRKIEADFLAVNASFVDRDFVQRAHQRGQQVYVWTVNDAATMSSMISRGVDGLITDKPDLARSVLAQRAKMSAAERLLVEMADAFGVASQIDAQ